MADVRLPVSLLKTDPLVPPPDTVDDSDREGRPYPHWVGGSRKRSEQSTNADQKSLETVFRLPFVADRAKIGNGNLCF